MVGHSSPLSGMALARVNSQLRLVTGSLDKTARMWHVQNGNLLFTFAGHALPVSIIKVHCETLATGAVDGSVQVWNLQKQRIRHAFRAHPDGGVSDIIMQDGMLITASDDCTARIWDLDSGDLVRSFIGHSLPIWTLALWGSLLVTGSMDETVRLWDIGTGKEESRFLGHTSAVTKVDVLGDFLFTASTDHTARCWEVRTGELLQCFHGHSAGVSSLAPFIPSMEV